MSRRLSLFLLAFVGLVLGNHTSAAIAGPMEAIVDRVFATAERKLTDGMKRAVHPQAKSTSNAATATAPAIPAASDRATTSQPKPLRVWYRPFRRN